MTPTRGQLKKLLSFTWQWALPGLLLFSACAKYEQGPWLSFLTKEKRLAQTWQVNAAFLPDGTNFLPTFKNQHYTLEREGLLHIAFTRPDTTETIEGKWELIEQKEVLLWTVNADSTRRDSLGYPYDSITYFDILRLTQSELRLIDTLNRRLYLEPLNP